MNRKGTTFLCLALALYFGPSLLAQEADKPAATEGGTAESPPAEGPPAKVEVKPVSLDGEIAARIERILKATEWFDNPSVEVSEGVVFLEGSTNTDERKEWATKLANNTQDVVAVANRIRVEPTSIWDFTPAWNEIDTMRRNSIQSLPILVLALLLLLMTYLATKGSAALGRRIVTRRTDNPLLRDVLTKALVVPVILLGIYLTLRVTGLTRLAATVLGGTGLLGLVLGIAFRDIAENFLASLLISMQRPFRAGDNVSVDGRTGVVQSVTTRGTTLMTADGNHVRIPNSTIYKSVIENLTANPKQRQKFCVSISEDDSISETQQVILKILQDHEAVLKSPEPLVLVDRYVRPRIMFQVYFWINVQQHAGDKVRSAIIRLTKIALEEQAKRKVKRQQVSVSQDGASRAEQPAAEDRSANTPSEGSLASDTEQIETQAREARSIDEGTDLLQSKSQAPSAK